MFQNFKFHHIGVVVFSIEKTAKMYAATLKRHRFFPLGKAVEAVAFGGRSMQFFYHKDVGLIEIVEAI